MAAPTSVGVGFDMTQAANILADLGWSGRFQSQLGPAEVEHHFPARIREVHRNVLDTLSATGEIVVPLTPELTEGRVAVGDWLLIAPDGQARLLERKSQINRKAAGHVHYAQAIAANVDTLFIVTSCNNDFNLARLERYLVMAGQAGVEPIIVLTKADLADDPSHFRRDAERGLPGVFVETLVATDDTDVREKLGRWCRAGQTVALLGSSGVGKTTLTNTLTGRLEKTHAIREADAKGRHTTTTRSMHPMRDGGWLIDTPGMRELQLYDMAEGIETVFDDLAELADQCKFHDCAHETEPGCAIQGAISSGEVDQARFARWQKLLREDEINTESVAQAHTRARKRQQTYNQGKKRSKHKRQGYDQD